MIKKLLLLSVALVFLFSSVTSKLPKHFFAHKGAQWSGDLNKVPLYQQLILQAHNQVRSEVGVPDLKWNSEAAKVAQSWSNKCIFQHDLVNKNYGQNLAVIAIYNSILNGNSRVITEEEILKLIPESIKLWADEKNNYDYASNGCSQGEVCGHYTQMVWKSSTSVGCGITQCDDLIDWFSSFYLVCNYSPPGNYIDQRPY